MNILNNITNTFSILTMNRLILCILVLFNCVWMSVSLHAKTASEYFDVNHLYSDAEVQQQVLSMTSNIELRYNKEIKTLINNYISQNYRKDSEVIMSRSKYYFSMIEQIIAEKNLPEELKYLCVIESSLRPSVRSKAGAVGLWQFMSGTARMYKLKVARHIDERKDIKRSTAAALEYLNDLYQQFDDWALALAAYNCGPGNVRKAIRRSGGKRTYWEVRKYLPKETRKYLPKFIARMYIMRYAESFGISGDEFEYTPYNSFGVAKIYDKTSFKKISEYSGLSIKEIKKHNPSYNHSYIPRSTKGNILILPETYLLTYLQNVNSLHQLEQVFYVQGNVVHAPVLEEEIPAEVEDDLDEVDLKHLRKYYPTEKLQTDMLPLKSLKVQSVGKAVAQRQQKIESFEVYRLAKRQSLDLFLDQHGFEADDVIGSVSAQGLVKIRR